MPVDSEARDAIEKLSEAVEKLAGLVSMSLQSSDFLSQEASRIEGRINEITTQTEDLAHTTSGSSNGSTSTNGNGSGGGESSETTVTVENQ